LSFAPGRVAAAGEGGGACAAAVPPATLVTVRAAIASRASRLFMATESLLPTNLISTYTSVFSGRSGPAKNPDRAIIDYDVAAGLDGEGHRRQKARFAAADDHRRRPHAIDAEHPPSLPLRTGHPVRNGSSLGDSHGRGGSAAL